MACGVERLVAGSSTPHWRHLGQLRARPAGSSPGMAAMHYPEAKVPCTSKVCSSQPPRKGNINSEELRSSRLMDKPPTLTLPKSPRVALGTLKQRTWEIVGACMQLPLGRERETVERIFLPEPLPHPVVILWTWPTGQLSLLSESLGPSSLLGYIHPPQPQATHLFRPSEPASRSPGEKSMWNLSETSIPHFHTHSRFVCVIASQS